jgi:hypothetical protein
MVITWQGTAVLGPGQVATAFTEMDILMASTVGFNLTVDAPAFSLTFTWDGQQFGHSGDVPEEVIGIELVNMTMPEHDCCIARVKYVSETTVSSTAAWDIVSGDGDLQQASLTVE